MSPTTSCSEMEALLPAYAERSLPADQAEAVAAHLAGCARCQQQVQQLRTLADDLDAALPEAPRTALRANFMAMLEQQKALLTAPAVAAPSVASAPEAKVVSLWPAVVANTWLRVAAAIVLIAGGVLLGRQLPGRADQGQQMAAAPANSTSRLAQVLAGRSKETVSASDRIQLVNKSGRSLTPGDPTVQVLINTLNFDPNTNVRLAACEALYRLRADPRVGEAFVHSLPIQTDPNVQITLIELLVALRDPRAVPSLERLARRPDALPVVRDQAKAGLGKLI
jgi:hypothetical protein